jgi:hypothetical protein
LKQEVFEWLWNEKRRINEFILQEKMKTTQGKVKALLEGDEIYIGDIIEGLIARVSVEAEKDKQYSEVKQE